MGDIESGDTKSNLMGPGFPGYATTPETPIPKAIIVQSPRGSNEWRRVPGPLAITGFPPRDASKLSFPYSNNRRGWNVHTLRGLKKLTRTGGKILLLNDIVALQPSPHGLLLLYFYKGAGKGWSIDFYESNTENRCLGLPRYNRIIKRNGRRVIIVSSIRFPILL